MEIDKIDKTNKPLIDKSAYWVTSPQHPIYGFFSDLVQRENKTEPPQRQNASVYCPHHYYWLNCHSHTLISKSTLLHEIPCTKTLSHQSSDCLNEDKLLEVILSIKNFTIRIRLFSSSRPLWMIYAETLLSLAEYLHTTS